MAEKLYYSMGEIAEMFDVKPSLIRHWETQFGVLKPKRNKKGNRLFTPSDVEHLKLIYHLVKEQGMTLEGARKALKQARGNQDGTSRDMELLERLQRVRALLVEVREDLKAGEGELVEDMSSAETASRAVRRKPVVRIEETIDENAILESNDAGSSKTIRRRKKKGEEESKELFAFYEQSLF